MSSVHDPVADVLAGVPLFAELDGAALATAAGVARELRVREGQTIVREGERARLFYLVISGRVKLTQTSAEGHEVILRMLGAGEPFGGVAIFSEHATHPVTARTVEPTAMLTWEGPHVLMLMHRYPSIAINIARLLAGRLHDLQRQHRELMTERVERRIARALLRLAGGSGRAVAAGVEIDFPLSRQDVAQMTGTTLYTVSRTLSGWAHAGLIATGRRRVTIRQPEALVRIAEDLPPAG